MYFKYSFITLLITIGLLLQFTCISLALSEVEIEMCAKKEIYYVDECKKLHKSITTDKTSFKKACCSTFAIEECVLNKVPELCRANLRERYQADGLKKGACKAYIGNCDEIGTTHQPTTIAQFNAKPETLKQSISYDSVILPTLGSNQVAEEQKNNGLIVSMNTLLMFTSSCSLVVVNLCSRWFSF